MPERSWPVIGHHHRACPTPCPAARDDPGRRRVFPFPRGAAAARSLRVSANIPLLSRTLGLPVGHVGAMGSRRTHDERLERLRNVGVPEAQLARLYSPIGLDLGACTPEETAISITAEIIAHANGGSGLPLSHGTGSIHRADRVPSLAGS